MAIVPVVKVDNEEGQKKLATPAQKVGEDEFKKTGFLELIQNLKDTMKATNGVGIAAPQIGVLKSVVIVGFEKNARYPDEAPVPLTVLINPVLEYPSDNRFIEGWEGCLSVPGVRGLVPRYERIQVSGFDLDGNKVDFEASGFQARIWQHECDHLKGYIFTKHAVRLVNEDEYFLMLNGPADPDASD